LVAPGCETNDSTLFIVGVMDIKSTDCTAQAESGARVLAGGVVDLTLRPSYTAALLVGSQLTQRGSREQTRTETAYLNIEGAEIELANADGTALDLGAVENPFSVFGTGLTPPAAGTDPGYGSVFVDLIPGSVSGSLPNGVVLARVRVYGTTLGRQEIESNQFTFPIQICRGCLIAYPATNTGAVGRVECTADGTAVEEINECMIGQDAFVPCSFCKSTRQACSDACLNCAFRDSLGPEQCSNSPALTCP
jgi:hypothetical protein